MAQPKVQLVAPIGNINLPGMTATGVVTATSLSGIATGSVTNLTGSPDLDVGIVTGSSFVGDGTGHAASLTGTPNLNLGVTTATSFVGDAVGKAAGLTGTPNLNVGLITATSFVGFVTGDVTGNISGLAASVTPGVNLGVGVCTAIQYHGDGSGITGAGSSAYVAQEVNASGDETIIDLSYGNVIYYKGQVDTTVGFASTSPAEQLTFIRDTSLTFDVAYNESFSTGGVTFDGTGDYLSMADNAAFQLGTGDWTMECFWKSGSGNTGNYQQLFGTQAVFAANNGIYRVGTVTNTNQIYFSRADGSGFEEPIWNINVNDEAWHHIAFTRASGYVYCWVDGVEQTNVGESNNISGSMTTSNSFYIGYNARDNSYNTGTVSSLRIVKGTAVYTTGTDFLPPSAALTNVTNTVLLCCQSDSSTTASTVSAGTITANGDPAAGAQTVAYSGTNTLPNSTSITWPDRVKWNDNITPTLFTNARTTAMQVFHFTTVDTGLNYNAWEEMNNNAETFGLYGAGATGYGGLGINVSSGSYFSSPVQVPGTSWSSLVPTGFAASAMGAIKSDGTMWVWGSTNYGILGLNVYGAGLSNSVSSPIQLGTETTWDNVSFGGNDSAGCMAIKTDGTLWGWGQNRYGNLGLNTSGSPGSLPNEYLTSRSSPTQVGTDTTWKFVNYGGEDCVLAIKTNGTLWSWGSNLNGQAGQNTAGQLPPGNTPPLRSSPVQVGTNTSWAYVSNCRNGTSIATKTDGTLWCWGDNSKGQCGQNTNSSPSYSGISSPTQVGSGTDWNYDNGSKIVVGYQRVFAIKTNGTLWGWGRTAQGQLGLNEGSYKDYSSPTQIPGTNWSTIKSVGEVIATKTDGTLWTWGDNGPGALMLNDRTDRSSPTQVPGIWNTGERGIRAASPHFALKVE